MDILFEGNRLITSLPALLSTPAPAALDANAIRSLSAEAGHTAQGEFKCLGAWIASSEFTRPMDIEIDRSCVHTARLPDAIARLQNARAMRALAFGRLDDRGVVQRIVVERAG